MIRASAAVAAVLALAACTERPVDPLNPGGSAAAAPAGKAPLATDPATAPDSALPTPAPANPGAAPPADPAAADKAFAAAYQAPQIYMAIQPNAAGPTSVVFSIDRERNNTPSDDPAIRLTPENGKCNPQQLRYFNFPAQAASRPVYGPDEAFRGVTARDLPDFMAMSATRAMLDAGLIADPEQSHPQNVCTKKLFERLIIDRSTASSGAGTAKPAG